MIKNSIKHFLVIGYGSIGSRHCRLLHKLGHEVAVVTHREDCPFLSFSSINSALKKFPAEILIIANRTSDHASALLDIVSLNYNGIIIVEKPLFSRVENLISEIDPAKIFVAYNLRFHPIVQRMKHILKEHTLYSAQFYVGQYLPTWRPDTDYRKCYSAFQSQGGGALRDLSHELDMSQWLTGRWKSVTALGGKFSDLTIDSDDLFCLLMETEYCPVVTIQVNYLDRCTRREIVVNADGISIKADLITGKLIINDCTENFESGRDETYSKQLSALSNEDYSEMCSYIDGVEVMKLIEASEKAAEGKKWIRRI